MNNNAVKYIETATNVMPETQVMKKFKLTLMLLTNFANKIISMYQINRIYLNFLIFEILSSCQSKMKNSDSI